MTLNLLGLQEAPYIYDISRLRVKGLNKKVLGARSGKHVTLDLCAHA
jgi:hypothetical protein